MEVLIQLPRNAFIEANGTVGGAHTTITMVIPNVTKGYVINNQAAYTTTTNVIKIKTAPGLMMDLQFHKEL